MEKKIESPSEEHLGRIEPAKSGFVCEVVHADDVGEQRLTLQESAISPKGANVEVALRFKLGRVAAHRGLTQFGETKANILRGDAGEPIFPAGYVGSISHTQQTAVAVVGRSADFLGLGVDIEKSTREIQSNVVERIGIAQEKQWVKQAPRERALMLFCAKESIYKALFPLHRRPMSFKDVALKWDDEHGAFLGTLLTDFGSPWDAGATVLTLCQRMDEFIVAVTVIEQHSDQD